MSDSRSHSSKTFQATEFSHTISSSMAPTLTSTNPGGSNDDNSKYKRTDITVTRATPILFSTYRGLHLRLTQPAGILPSIVSNISSASNKELFNGYCPYQFRSCDLERWSTVELMRLN